MSTPITNGLPSRPFRMPHVLISSVLQHAPDTLPQAAGTIRTDECGCLSPRVSALGIRDGDAPVPRPQSVENRRDTGVLTRRVHLLKDLGVWWLRTNVSEQTGKGLTAATSASFSQHPKRLPTDKALPQGFQGRSCMRDLAVQRRDHYAGIREVDIDQPVAHQGCLDGFFVLRPQPEPDGTELHDGALVTHEPTPESFDARNADRADHLSTEFRPALARQHLQSLVVGGEIALRDLLRADAGMLEAMAVGAEH
ncbi:hypothetical protein [Streptomyces sp. NBC_01578]|uniref:hypothetical protein n=1 Tax=Streptomyces sp. NBC_01578 TaxID=2975884 RepID=UPI0038658742